MKSLGQQEDLIGTKWECKWREHTIRLRVVEVQDTPTGPWALYHRLDSKKNSMNSPGGMSVDLLHRTYRRVR